MGYAVVGEIGGWGDDGWPLRGEDVLPAGFVVEEFFDVADGERF